MTQRTKNFWIFVKKAEWLSDYSFFMAVKTFSKNREWQQWEPGLRDRVPESMEEYRTKLAEQICFWQFCQYQFFSQWNRLRKYANSRGIQIIGDLPFYAATDSADVWVHRESFSLNKDGTPLEAAGCPPDVFSENAQKWGNPLYNWAQMEKQASPGGNSAYGRARNCMILSVLTILQAS